MAKRKPLIIDAEVREVDAATPLSQLVPAGTQSVVTHGGKIVPREHFDQTRADQIDGGFDTNAARIERGGGRPVKTVPLVVDGIWREVAPDTPLGQLVPSGTRTVVTHGGKIVPREHFDGTRADQVDGGFDTNAASIQRGGMRDLLLSPRDRVLQGELALLQGWLDSFDPSPQGLREAALNPTGELLSVRGFPLPDSFEPDEIDLVLYVENYPSVAPIGIYLLDAPVFRPSIARIRSRLNLYDRQAFHGAEPPLPGYLWVCLYTRDWRVDTRDLRRGQNLMKFLATFYAMLNDD